MVPRRVEVITRIVGHAQPTHDGPRTLVQLGGVRDDLVELEVVEGEIQGGDCSLCGIAMTPHITSKGPADVHCRAESSVEVRGSEAGEAEEATIFDPLERPQPESVLVEACLGLVDQSVALVA